MTEIYNKSQEKEKRRQLRKNQTKTEEILWQKIRNRQLNGYKFRRQYSVNQFVLDFYCPQEKLAIEIDGDSHFVDGAQEYDQLRQNIIESFGIRFLRFTNDDVYQNIDAVLEVILSNLPPKAITL